MDSAKEGKGPRIAGPVQEENELTVLLLMTVLSQSLFTFVRRNLMTLSFFTTRHNTPMNFVNNNF